MTFLDTIFENLRTEPELARLIEVRGKALNVIAGNALLDLIARARGYIESAGVAPGDRVAILAPNSARWVAADLGALASGGIVVPLYDRQAPAELAVMLRSAAPRLLLCGSRELADAVAAAWSDRGECTIVVFDELFAHAPSHDPVHAFAPDDTAAIIYTSGTSGEPKGVMLTRANVDFMLQRTVERLDRVVARTRGPGRTEPDRVFHFLPFCFAASRIMLWTQLYRPNPLMMSTELSNLVVEIATASPNYFLNVPAVLERIRSGVGSKIRERGGAALWLYERGQAAYRAQLEKSDGVLDALTLALARRVVFSKIKRQIGVNLEFLISGSAPLSEDTQRWFEMLGIPVYQAYGLTETTGIVSLDEPGRVVPGRVGVAIDGVECRLSDAGELQVRGPNVFRGYWRAPEASARAVTDGWFRTGDQVDLEGDNLKIIGRLKNLIVPESGHNVAPEPIEEKFMTHCPEAEQCMLVGHARPFLSILVTGGPPREVVEAAIERAGADQPFYKRIKEAILVDETFTPESGLLTANQKLRRQVIEDHFKPQIDAVYDAYFARKAERARAPT